MYNEELKSRFIEERYAKTPAFAISAKALFSMLGKYEQGWQADIYTKSSEEISKVLSESLIRSVRGESGSARKKRSIIISYVEWCIKNNIEGVNKDALNLQIPKSKGNIENILLHNPDDLSEYLNKVFDKVEDETADIIYRCYCWMAYMGFQELEALETRRGDVDFGRSQIIYEHMVYPMYPQSIEAFKKCATLTQFKVPRYRYVYNADRAKGNRLLRGISEGANTPNRMQHELARKTTKALNAGLISSRLSYYQIWLSGHFYRAFEFENAESITPIMPEVYFGRLADKQMTNVKYSIQKGTSLNTIKNRQVKHYLLDYEAWKNAVIVTQE